MIKKKLMIISLIKSFLAYGLRELDHCACSKGFIHKSGLIVHMHVSNSQGTIDDILWVNNLWQSQFQCFNMHILIQYSC